MRIPEPVCQGEGGPAGTGGLPETVHADR